MLNDSPLVTIIIVTMNRCDLLKKCLEYVAISSYKNSELFIIDGTDNPEMISINRQNSEAIQATYINEPKIGVSKGRNIGINMSHGEIIYFVDDDILISKDAIKNTISNFSDPKVMACGVRLLPPIQQHIIPSDGGNQKFKASSKDLTMSTLLNRIIYQAIHLGTKIPSSKLPPPLNTGPLCFFPYRKQIFSIAGQWDESLGGGTPANGAEDVDMAYRVLKAGYDIVYEPTALVEHVSHRQSVAQLHKLHYRMGVVAKALLLKYRKDCYMNTLWVCSFFNHGLHMMRYFITFKKLSGKLEWAYISGWLKGPK
jgi:O-antigen biosynthesis protein